jgi:hypothetical protein
LLLLMVVVVLCGCGRGSRCGRCSHVLEAPMGEMLLLLVLVVHAAGAGEPKTARHSAAGHYSGWHNAVTGCGRGGRTDHRIHVLLLLLLLVYTRFVIPGLSHVAGGVAAVAAVVTDVVVYRRCGCFCILTVDR